MKSERQRRLVLTEEKYTENLSSIVARDFFPDVSKLERKNALLDRRLEGDVTGAIAVRRETRRLAEKEEIMAAKRKEEDHDLVEEERPGAMILRPAIDSKTSRGGKIRKRPRPLEEETVTGFVARATNEDNDEFDSNQKRDSEAYRQRIDGFHASDKKNSNILCPERIHKPLLEMASDDFAPESNEMNWTQSKTRNSLFFNPTPQSYPSHNNHGTVDDEKQRSLMPPPSIKNDKRKSTTHLSKGKLIEYIPKHNLEKKIEPRCTRFPPEKSLTSNVGGNVNGINVEGMDSETDSDCVSSTTGDSTDLDAPLRTVEEERHRYKRYRYKRKQRSNRRSYIAMTPQIIPGAENGSPITTWGSVDSTPIVLSGCDEKLERPSPSPFRITSKSERELAASKAEKLLARRTRLASSSSTATALSSSKLKVKEPGITAHQLGSITPGALSLLERTKSARSRRDGEFASALRTSYSYQLRPSSSSSNRRRGKSKRRDNAFNATPQI